MIPFAKWFLATWSSAAWYENSGLVMLVTLFSFVLAMVCILLATIFRCLVQITALWIEGWASNRRIERLNVASTQSLGSPQDLRPGTQGYPEKKSR
jgi:hypothetical protein